MSARGLRGPVPATHPVDPLKAEEGRKSAIQEEWEEFQGEGKVPASETLYMDSVNM